LYGSAGAKLGGLLHLFGGIVALGVFSVLGVRRTLPWTRAILAGAAVAWSLTSIGVLISLGDIGRVNPGWSLAVGYWCLWASVLCV
jgi:hypothetical protein